MFHVLGSSINRVIIAGIFAECEYRKMMCLLINIEKNGSTVEDCVVSHDTAIIQFPIKVLDYIKLHTNDFMGMIYDLEMLKVIQ